MITAKWKEGYGIYQRANAQTVAEEIMAIGDDATPQEIVAKARDDSTELHKCFEWDDDLAAEKYRLIQAREIVRHLVIKEDEVPKDRPEVRFFFKPNKDEGYKPTKVVVRKEDEYQRLLAQAWAELQAFKQKYSCLVELKEILELIN